MGLVVVSRVLRQRRKLRAHERWTREQLETHQGKELDALRAFAYARSPFYWRFHGGLTEAPLEELPVLTKAVLMDHFDEVSTNPAVRLRSLETYLETLRGNELFVDRFSVAATSGSSGRKSIIPSDPAEWAMTIASYARANEWAGIKAGPTRRVSMAVVSSTTTWHQSSRVAATVRSPLFFASERLDAATPLPDIVSRLNQLQPQVLVAYASMIKALAHEQVAGRLSIAPKAVNSSSEVLTTEARALAARAWGVTPFNVYAATETGGVAADCHEHHRMHLFEDLVIPEVVDADYRPVPTGETGDRLLVTVLFSRTLPLIRYELTDRVQLATELCGCPLPFRLVGSIEGRTDDALVLPRQGGGTVRVHPVVFHQALEMVDVAGWQVRQQPDGITVLVTDPGPGFDTGSTQGAVRAAMARAGALPSVIRVGVVDAIPASAAGKRPLVVAAGNTAL